MTETPRTDDDASGRPRQRHGWLIIFLAAAGIGSVELMRRRMATPVVEEALSDVADPVVWIWAGAAGPDGFTVRFRLVHESPSASLLVSESADMTSAQRFEPVSVPSPGEPRALYLSQVNGMTPGTRYFYAVEADGQIDRGRIGSLRTPRDDPFTFQFAFASCARTGSNSVAYDAIRAEEPLLFLHMGDFHYQDIPRNDAELFLAAFDRVLQTPRPGQLFRNTSVAYMWDDHDFGPDDSDSSSPGRRAAQAAYRAYVPHYPLIGGEDAPIQQAFTIGRVRFLVTDMRSQRTPGGVPRTERSILGRDQKEWLKDELRAASSSHPVVFWVNTVPWINIEEEGADHWGGFPEERREMSDFIAGLSLQGLFMLSGDAHMLAYDDGTNNTYASQGGPGFPVFHAAPLDGGPMIKGGPYTGEPVLNENQFGLVRIEDDGGKRIRVRYTGKTADGETRLEAKFEIDVAD